MIAEAWILESLAIIGIGRWAKRKQELDMVYGSGPQSARRLPVVDRYARRLAGNPSKTVTWTAARLVKMIRGMVNTKAFEHLVEALLNKQSKLHRFAKRPPVTDGRFVL